MIIMFKLYSIWLIVVIMHQQELEILLHISKN